MYVVMGATRADGVGPIVTCWEAERALARLPGARTYLRPGYFFEDWAGVVGPARAEGILPTFLPAHLVIPQIAARDVGAAAACALLEPPPAAATVIRHLAGAEASARAVTPVEAPLAAVVPTLQAHGMTPGAAALYRDLYAGLRAGTVGHAPGAAVERTATGTRAALAALVA